jgi:hypothetical protein
MTSLAPIGRPPRPLSPLEQQERRLQSLSRPRQTLRTDKRGSHGHQRP